ncbi:MULTISPECIES: DUF1381 domain-containing protein [unclassified Staphylococcus]|uniref:DUF1381 domain-containing protein n=1 Tax=unclassified Staphylococcus TaxID=91994 RepID=UPI0021D07F73|nr:MULTISPECIES: DUF1381 domain-containing protein [unclassified Staphylococcus]UXR75612.1 DUF1381 domain-containing protein [Staphylococcus sp. IVB6233]UXR79812.1 DUF1381 domain-containing protein [Staphylococcus sp. IVB6218]
MTQYLITTFTDSTGETFKEVIKPRHNQTFEVVEADSKEEAIKKYESPKVKQQVIACNTNAQLNEHVINMKNI